MRYHGVMVDVDNTLFDFAEQLYKSFRSDGIEIPEPAIKMCDRIDNLIDFPHSSRGSGFSVLYLQESKDLLDALRDTALASGYDKLYAELATAISNMKMHIETHANTG